MRFYKIKGKRCLDMTGNLLLHKTKEPITCSIPSAMPHKTQGGHSVSVKKGGRILATIEALNFIWSK